MVRASRAGRGSSRRIHLRTEPRILAEETAIHYIKMGRGRLDGFFEQDGELWGKLYRLDYCRTDTFLCYKVNREWTP